MTENTIELLAPAKNVEIGKAAIDHGADAVYIGAPRFGARAVAGNTKEDIAQLVQYAHLYGAKVYVTLNTILKDDELEAAKDIVWDMYNIGVDALIVQDMGLLMMDLPPISLHASTQCDVRTVEKVKFLEECGFEQVVLARETSLETMREIKANTNVAIEAFVHGALCVSYSGQCYMSAAYNGRSANRGECAQLCRLPYDVVDEDGTIILKKKHVLSLKDFDASLYVRDMIDAGVKSFKIEGRLKDVAYVKNITAYYRTIIDKVMAEKKCEYRINFTPDPKKTFYRGATRYFLEERMRDVVQMNTPKSMGEPVGRVRDVWRNALSLDSTIEFTNGDGLCYINKTGEFEGFRVNKVESGGRLLPLKMPNIEKGTMLYRNHNEAFAKQLSAQSGERLIPLDMVLSHTGDTFVLMARDVDGYEASVTGEFDWQDAKNVERAMATITAQLSKLGGTPFIIREILVECGACFLPSSVLNEWRRAVTEKLIETRIAGYERNYTPLRKDSTHAYPTNAAVDYRLNVYNQKARDFYAQHGVEISQMAFESEPLGEAELMRCKHCIRHAIGQCLRDDKPENRKKWYIENERGRFALLFDCKSCEMVIKLA